MSSPAGKPLSVAVVGCGLIGHKRSEALAEDQLVGCFDTAPAQTAALAAKHQATACQSLEELLELKPDVVVVATTHDNLAGIACKALASGAHVLVEKPAGIGTADIALLKQSAEAAGKKVKVGFNHRFHPAIQRAVAEAHSGRFGDVMSMRARYGHGGRIGYDREWRAQRAISGGGEIVDQGMHLLDISYWLLGPLPVHSALVKTQFWDTDVDDNAALILAEKGPQPGPWTMFHVTWTEWKNLFSLEIYCRTGKLQIDGLAGSYGAQKLTIYTMKPELGPPDVEVIDYPAEDVSWRNEWLHFKAVLAGEQEFLLGDLESAQYAWECVESAYAMQGS